MADPARPFTLVEKISDLFARLLLRPQIRVPEPPAEAGHDLATRADELNTAAEQYYLDTEAKHYIQGKPFSDPFAFPRYLFNLGVLFEHLQVGPGDVVLELGAGSAWVSHFLNLFGCQTIAVDVSPTALEMAREVFEQNPRTRWDLDPQFLPYDGYRLPLADGQCDRIVLHDAFHHIPNTDQLLAEMARVLRPGGIVAMSEPGREHSASEVGQQEAAETGVLENDVVVEELDRQARTAGFDRTLVVPVALNPPPVPAADFPRFLQGKGFTRFWKGFTGELLAQHFILIYKGEPQPTTRRPGWLAAEIAVETATAPLIASAGEELQLDCRLRNRGDTRWIAGGARERAGDTRLGARLQKPGEDGLRDWARAPLPQDIAPGGEAAVTLTLRAPDEAGSYRVVLDLVAEQVAWFADRGSPTTVLELEVEGPQPASS
ncbi:MAG: methyltransferase domain-containing protein [Acidobacteriota bacterium]